jgi:hypothetical protein
MVVALPALTTPISELGDGIATEEVSASRRRKLAPRPGKFSRSNALLILKIESVDLFCAPIEHNQGRIIGQKTDPVVPKTT